MLRLLLALAVPRLPLAAGVAGGAVLQRLRRLDAPKSRRATRCCKAAVKHSQ